MIINLFIQYGKYKHVEFDEFNYYCILIKIETIQCCDKFKNEGENHE